MLEFRGKSHDVTVVQKGKKKVVLDKDSSNSAPPEFEPDARTFLTIEIDPASLQAVRQILFRKNNPVNTWYVR